MSGREPLADTPSTSYPADHGLLSDSSHSTDSANEDLWPPTPRADDEADDWYADTNGKGPCSIETEDFAPAWYADTIGNPRCSVESYGDLSPRGTSRKTGCGIRVL